MLKRNSRDSNGKKKVWGIVFTGIVVLLLFYLGFSLGQGSVRRDAEQQPQEITGSSNGEEEKEKQQADEEAAPEVQAEGKEKIAGITLNMTKNEVLSLLGKDYHEEYVEEGFYYGESYSVWNYPTGISLLIGAETEQVLEIAVTSPDFPTVLGAKVGDKAKDVLAKYGEKYPVPESIHGSGKLIGWFNLADHDLIIFDFDLEDGSTFNEDVQPDSPVEQIKLTNWKYFD